MNIFANQTAQQAKALYREICKEQHPDKGGNLLLMQAVNAMYSDYLAGSGSKPEAVNLLAQGSNTDNDIENILNATGLNWNVRKEAVITASGVELPDHCAIINESNGLPLAVMGSGYTPVQNSETLKTVLKAGAAVFAPNSTFNHPWNNSETLGSYGNVGGGSLREGRKVFFQIDLPTAYIGKSDIKRYITATNSHDGSTSFGFGTTSQVVCCANTFAIANRELSKFKHTINIDARINEAANMLSRVIEIEKRQMELFTKAANTRIEVKQIEGIKKAVFPKFDFNSFENNSTRAKNQMGALEAAINTSFNEQCETVWALFNGVTRYTNHDAPAMNATPEDITYNLMFGSLAKQNKAAYNWLESQF